MAQKATDSYKMSKEVKRILAVTPKHLRSGVKEQFIQAELFAEWHQKFGSRREKKDAE